MMQPLVCLAVLVSFPGHLFSAQQTESLADSVVFACSIKGFAEFNSKLLNTSTGKYLNHPKIKDCLQIDFSQKQNPVLELIMEHDLVNQVSGDLTFAIVKTKNEVKRFVLVVEQQEQTALRKLVTQINEISQSGRINGELFVKNQDARVIVSDDATVLKQIRDGGFLYKNTNVKNSVLAAQKRLSKHDFWFFLDPLELIDQKRWRNEKFYSLAQKEGIQSLRFLGAVGVVENSGASRVVGSLVAKKPFQRGMRLFNLANGQSRELPAMFANASSGGFIRLELENLTEALTTVFDALVADGEDGVFEAVLHDLKNDKSGPMIDVEKEVIGNLVSPAFFCTHSKKNDPATAVCFKLKDSRSFSDTLGRFYDGDEKAEKLTSDFDAWEIKPLAVDGAAKQPYIVAVKSGYFCIGPDISSINSLQVSSVQKDSLRLSKLEGELDSFSFGYYLDIRQLLFSSHNNLNSPDPTGILMDMAKRLNLDVKVDKSKVPNFDQLDRDLNSKLRLLGKTTNGGWDFVVEID